MSASCQYIYHQLLGKCGIPKQLSIGMFNKIIELISRWFKNESFQKWVSQRESCQKLPGYPYKFLCEIVVLVPLLNYMAHRLWV